MAIGVVRDVARPVYGRRPRSVGQPSSSGVSRSLSARGSSRYGAGGFAANRGTARSCRLLFDEPWFVDTAEALISVWGRRP